jgi:hypothetical protein
MRMVLRVSIPVEKGNEAMQSGTLRETIEASLAVLKPEAAYFWSEGGERTGMFVFDMEGSWQLPLMLEPLFQTLNASVHLTPAMSVDDLTRAMGE